MKKIDNVIYYIGYYFRLLLVMLLIPFMNINDNTDEEIDKIVEELAKFISR